MNHKRVVITGIGVVAPNGIGKDQFWQAMLKGESAIGPITRFDAKNYATRFAGEVKNFTPHPKISSTHLASMDRAYQMGVSAAFQAVEDASMDLSLMDVSRGGVYMGLAVAGVDSYEKEFKKNSSEKKHSVKNWYQGWFPSACSGYISVLLGLRGSNSGVVVYSGCDFKLMRIPFRFRFWFRFWFRLYCKTDCSYYC
jgi:3-oxoacyl-[acyl-carrier-protein] synthase II